MEILVKECRQGNRHSQKKLYMVFFGYAMSVCERYASDKDDAIEIMNDGFLKVFKSLDNFHFQHHNPEAAFRAWLKQIMVFTAIDRYRKDERTLKTESIEQASHQIAQNDESQMDKLSYKELLGFIHRLSPAYRTVFSLFVIDGLSHEEISNLLGISVGTSKSNLSKAKLNLLKMLAINTQPSSYERKVV